MLRSVKVHQPHLRVGLDMVLSEVRLRTFVVHAPASRSALNSPARLLVFNASPLRVLTLWYPRCPASALPFGKLTGLPRWLIVGQFQSHPRLSANNRVFQRGRQPPPPLCFAYPSSPGHNRSLSARISDCLRRGPAMTPFEPLLDRPLRSPIFPEPVRVMYVGSRIAGERCAVTTGHVAPSSWPNTRTWLL